MPDFSVQSSVEQGYCIAHVLESKQVHQGVVLSGYTLTFCFFEEYVVTYIDFLEMFNIR